MVQNLGNLWQEAGGFVVCDQRSGKSRRFTAGTLTQKILTKKEVTKDGENPRQ